MNQDSMLSIHIARQMGKKHSEVKQRIEHVMASLRVVNPAFVRANFCREDTTNRKGETIRVIRVFRPAYPLILGRPTAKEVRWVMENYYGMPLAGQSRPRPLRSE